MLRLTPQSLILIATLLAAAGCAEPECPDHYYKDGNVCRRIDAGSSAVVGDAGSTEASIATDGATGDASSPSGRDGETAVPDAAARDGAVSLDANLATEAGALVDGSSMADSSLPDAATVDAVTVDAATLLDAANGDVCAPSPCQHGGSCSRTAGGAVCDCAGTGYEGARCEIDIDECAKPNLCRNPEYPCVQTEAPGYTCDGLMADWPMPDSVLSANVRPSYDVDSVPGVVLDKVTGLAWQRELPAAYDRCSGNISVQGDSCTWEEAKAYCARLELAGSDDWRLPSKIETESIADDTQRQSPSIDAAVFHGTRAGYYWSRSTDAANPVRAWISGAHTVSLVASKTMTGGARCVRTYRRPASGTPDRRYTMTGASSLYPDIADRRTGLVWKLYSDAAPYEFETGRTHCAAFGGAWRLPTKKELLTLVDLGQPTESAKIDPVFNTTALAAYRSVSLFWDGVLLMSVEFATGSTLTRQNTDLVLVRCVR